MDVYKAKYHNGRLRLLEKPSKLPLTENAIVIFLGEEILPIRSQKKDRNNNALMDFAKTNFLSQIFLTIRSHHRL
jgi:hypothetical protein